MHSSRMRTVRSSSHLSRGEGLPQCILGYQFAQFKVSPPSDQAHIPPDQAPPAADPPDQDFKTLNA